MKSVLVYLSTYNGEKFLRALLDSLISQINVKLHLFIRDDGSRDGTCSIIEEYANNYPFINFTFGENIGYAKSFWQIFKLEEHYDYYAFCDQDDIWQNNKLIKAIELIEAEQCADVPILYTSNVISIDSDFNVLNDKTFEVNEVITFYESLLRSILPGCTFVFNKLAFNLISKYEGYLESHDWAVYCIVSAFGKVVFDYKSYIFYRIHSNNTIGKSNRFKELKTKIKRLFKPSKRSRSIFAKDFYECYKAELNKDYAEATKLLGYYRTERKKLRLIKDKRFKGFIFKILVLLGRV